MDHNKNLKKKPEASVFFAAMKKVDAFCTDTDCDLMTMFSFVVFYGSAK